MFLGIGGLFKKVARSGSDTDRIRQWEDGEPNVSRRMSPSHRPRGDREDSLPAGDIKSCIAAESVFQSDRPHSENRQGWDIGEQYRTGIYYLEEEDLPVIWQAVQQQQKKYEESIVTQVERLENFYLAEDYHQNYLEKYPAGYCHIHLGEAEAFIEEEGLRQLQRGSERIQAGAYQRPADEILRENLTDIQYHVTQNGGTELPYQNEYDRHFEKGIYVDVTTGNRCSRLPINFSLVADGRRLPSLSLLRY